VASGRALARWHYNSLRAVFYSYFIQHLNIDPPRESIFVLITLREELGQKSEAGCASLSENTARFRKKVATLN